jgi:hypothetical protein
MWMQKWAAVWPGPLTLLVVEEEDRRAGSSALRRRRQSVIGPLALGWQREEKSIRRHLQIPAFYNTINVLVSAFFFS